MAEPRNNNDEGAGANDRRRRRRRWEMVARVVGGVVVRILVEGLDLDSGQERDDGEEEGGPGDQ